MLKYSGKLYFDTPLNDKELSFLRGWQDKLMEIHEDYFPASKAEKEIISERINGHTGIAFDGYQRWAIFHAMCPMIEFHKNYIEFEGSSLKGNMREAVMAYHHFFLGEDAVLKQCLDLDFLNVHNMNGIVEGWRKDENTARVTQWCYLVKNNQFTSVEVPTIKEYEENPLKWKVIYKNDTFYEKLLNYFPPLMEYADIKKSINAVNSQIDSVVEKKPKKMKV
jgi:hypothetical protein